jgi:hypothetical protein
MFLVHFLACPEKCMLEYVFLFEKMLVEFVCVFCGQPIIKIPTKSDDGWNPIVSELENEFLLGAMAAAQK